MKLRALCAFAWVVCASCATTPTVKPLSHEERARFLVEIAGGSLDEGDPTGALQSLAQAEVENPTMPEIFHTRALAFNAKHDLPLAIQAAKRAVELKPDYSDANNTLGKLLMDDGQTSAAIKYLTLAASDILYRDAYKAQTNLGILNYRQGRFNKSLEYLNRAILSSPVLACVAYYYRGNLDLRDSNFKDAVRDYAKATQQVCANFQLAHLALGIALEESRQFDRARKTFLEIQKRFPNTRVADQAFEHLRKLP